MINVHHNGSAGTESPEMSRTIGINVAATGILSTIELATAENPPISGISSSIRLSEKSR